MPWPSAHRVIPQDFLGELRTLFAWVQHPVCTPALLIVSRCGTRRGACGTYGLAIAML